MEENQNTFSLKSKEKSESVLAEHQVINKRE